MNRASYISLLGAFLLLAGSCVGPEISFEYSSDDRASLWIRGEAVITPSDNSMQYSCNLQRNEYRVMDDRMSDYFMLKCNQTPSDIGQVISADMTYTTSDNVRTERGLEFEVMNIDQSRGLVWLWNQSRRVKVVIRIS